MANASKGKVTPDVPAMDLNTRDHEFKDGYSTAAPQSKTEAADQSADAGSAEDPNADVKAEAAANDQAMASVVTLPVDTPFNIEDTRLQDQPEKFNPDAPQTNNAHPSNPHPPTPDQVGDELAATLGPDEMPYWNRAKELYSVLQPESIGYIKPVLASRSAKVPAHTYAFGMRDKDGTTTIDDVQKKVKKADKDAKVLSLKGYVVDDAESNPTSAVQVIVALD